MSQHITIELCSADRDRLDRIINALTVLAGDTPNPSPAPAPSEAVEPTKDAEQAPEPAPQTTITQAEIQKAVVELCAQGKEIKAKVREIVTQYAKSVSGIPADKYLEVLTKLNALTEPDYEEILNDTGAPAV